MLDKTPLTFTENMALAPEPHCVACGSFETAVFWRGDNRTIRGCSSCDTLFVFPQPQPEQLHKEFQSDYFGGNGARGQNRLELEFESWRRPVLAKITKRIQEVKPFGKLLDVGCASGEIFEYFREGKWHLYGVEPSEMAFARACERFAGDPNVKLFNAYLRDMPPVDGFDVITVLESLFYMPDPRLELSYISRILKDDGLLVIATPGYAYQRLRHTGAISSLLYGNRCSLTSSHLYYFSRKGLSALLKGAGFRIFQAIPLGSSTYGSWWGRSFRGLYLSANQMLTTLTFGRVNLSPHVLYFCLKLGTD